MHVPPKRTEEVVSSWNHCHGAFYQVSENDLSWNEGQQKLLRYWRATLEGVPVLWAEATPEGAGFGISPNGIWLSLYGAIGEGKEAGFATAVEEFARKRGKARVAIGGDEFHFLPGIPVGDPGGERLARAFQEIGFSTADCADFVGKPANPASEGYIAAAIKESADRGWRFHSVESEKDKKDISAFLTREFSGRWSREWEVWSLRADTGRAFWNLLRDEKGVVLGFSRLAIRGGTLAPEAGWTPGAMRLPLNASGERADTDSCLGPIGIAASERGRGAGKVLLGLSLQELNARGANLVCIDWTNAYNYYTPLGFQVVRSYLSAWKGL